MGDRDEETQVTVNIPLHLDPDTQVTRELIRIDRDHTYRQDPDDSSSEAELLWIGPV